jgi:hypothetical protein
MSTGFGKTYGDVAGRPFSALVRDQVSMPVCVYFVCICIYVCIYACVYMLACAPGS